MRTHTAQQQTTSGQAAQLWARTQSAASCQRCLRVCACVLLQQYLSPEHARAMSGNNSQGPVYKIYVSDSIKLQGSQLSACSRGTARVVPLKQHAANHPSSCAAFVCACLPLQSSVGPQPDSTVPNPGSMTFGTAQRLPKPGKDGVPGPGMQQLVQAQHTASPTPYDRCRPAAHATSTRSCAAAPCRPLPRAPRAG